MTARGLGRVETQRVVAFGDDDPLILESGARLAPVQVAYETYGELDDARTNVVVICHALTGDAHAAGHHGDQERRGWWDTLIGPGKPVDTDRFFVISTNLLGGCQGTTGPASTDPATGSAYGLRFPLFTVRDLVTVQRRVLELLGLRNVYAVIGGSLGGMQALQWALDHPGEVDRAVIVCASARLSAQNIAFSAAARAGILRDPDFRGGDYPGTGRRPELGLSIARMNAHITYLSAEAMRRKFDRSRRGGPDAPRTMAADFEVEHYLAHQGEIFLERFDALSYLYLTRVMDYFEPFAERAATGAAQAPASRFLALSFDGDWRFGTEHSVFLTNELVAAGADARHVEIASPWGHDSFLLDLPNYHREVRDFLA